MPLRNYWALVNGVTCYSKADEESLCRDFELELTSSIIQRDCGLVD